jgi:hypothetical protein
MIRYNIKTEQRKFRGFDRFSKFLLVGNNIDGYVDIGVVEFNYFQEVIEQLPTLLEKMECTGEWNLKFFQVPDSYKLCEKYGYYKYPSRGKLIFELTYDRTPLQIIKVSIDNSMIHFGLIDKDIEEDWDEEEEDEEDYFIDLNLDEFYLTILLVESEQKKEIKDKYFKLRGNRFQKIVFGEHDDYF